MKIRLAATGNESRFDRSIYGQESNPTTWRLCKMNLAIRGIGGNIGPNNADNFLNDRSHSSASPSDESASQVHAQQLSIFA